MQATDILRALFGRGKQSAYKTSENMGRNKRYISVLMARNIVPRLDTMASIMDAIDYDLLVRSRQDGTEIIIDPPEE